MSDPGGSDRGGSDRGGKRTGDPGDSGGSWTLLTGHGHVLVEIARNAQARIRDIAAAAGIAERAHREYDGA